MFERFTERARKVVVLAQEEPGRLRHDYVGTEHLLLGLILEEEGVAARALCACGATLDGVREEVESTVGYGEEGTPPQAPFTPRTNKVLQHALSEALQLGHDRVGTEHILLGLVRESEGVAGACSPTPTSTRAPFAAKLSGVSRTGKTPSIRFTKSSGGWRQSDGAGRPSGVGWAASGRS